ncbi:MAG TPA: hypothetical protein VEQ58_21265, partial [Polyangiaceae bacterium]|nr:hypothetical protein [Polyangiaceae bacterium]
MRKDRRRESIKKAASAARATQPTAAALSQSASSPSSSGTLIAMELGAEWPGEHVAAGNEKRVLTQHEGEAPAVFAERVFSSIDALFGRGVELGTLALAC